VRIVDIRGHVLPASVPPPHYFNHKSDYDQGHIPGAQFVDWVLEITDPGDPRQAQIAKPERYAAVMSRLGIDEKMFVVAYDDELMMFASRLWWTLNYYGHRRVAVLDGGWKQWIAEGRPVTADVPHIKPTTFIPRPQSAWYRDARQVASAASGGTALLDLRSKEEYDGQYSRAKRAGHIPGATCAPRRSFVGDDGLMLSVNVLRDKFAQIGVRDTAQEVITYCNAGVSASFGLLALHVAGFTHSAVYDGSWKDWGNDDSRPIA
jgi:thiosulfate/3-mercaptopyruvate sulfurtransferase